MIHIHTAGERELVTRQSFDSFITSLKMDSRFYRCNRGVVINLEHAVDFDGTGFRLDNGNNVPVSRKLLKTPDRHLWNFCSRGGPEMTDILCPVLELSVIIPGILLAYLPVKAI